MVLGGSCSVHGAESDAYRERLEALAARCDELGLKDEAELTRGWHVERYPGRQYLFLPPATDATAPKAGTQQTVEQWYSRFRQLRREQAEALFAQAKAAATDDPSLAYQLVHEALREDPDHAPARRVLGFEQNARGEWRLPDEDRMAAQQARLDHPRLGWRARSYWRLETPHFVIVTNHSAKEALEAGRHLENLHALWRQIFFGYWSTPEALAARLAGGNEPLAVQRPKMQVVLFKSREEYVGRLSAGQPQIGMTQGYYLDSQRTSFFFAGDAQVHPTWRHEATHQLFQESVRDVVDNPGEEHNFWAIEGAALYMESLAEHDGYWTAGGCEAERLQFARYRALAGAFCLPLAELAGLGRESVQSSEEISRIYAQSAAVSQFLLDGDGGRHRSAFVKMLTDIYQGDAAADSLASLAKQDFGALDAAYRSFLHVTDDDLAGIPSPARLRHLSLGHTAVTDAGLAHLSEARQLEWLDLSRTSISDAGFQQLAGVSTLRQLFLDGSRLTSQSLPQIVRNRELELLDLANLELSDDSLAALADLRKLKTLYLSHTPITDAGLTHLRGLKQLELLDTTGTKVTPAALTRLKASLPKLRQ